MRVVVLPQHHLEDQEMLSKDLLEGVDLLEGLEDREEVLGKLAEGLRGLLEELRFLCIFVDLWRRYLWR